MGSSGWSDELIRARSEGRAVVAVNVYDAVGAKAVATASAREEQPAIIQTGSTAFTLAGRAALVAIALAVRDSTQASVAVHLDHCRDLDDVRFCLDAGYDSVMFDGSHLPFAENVRLTTTAAALAHNYGAWIEGELGGTAGDEDRSSNAAPGALTDPEEAATFVNATGVDALAVSVGNVHGIPTAPTSLALDVLDAIHERVEVPLVLHGASGLADWEIRAAITLGVAKVNINAEVRRAYLAALRASLAASRSDDLLSHMSMASEAASIAVRTKIRLLNADSRTEVKAT